ncbi:hypothetical protein VKT23_019806 [Stygiomarasmius scandens]|uniref:Uncharacterized protein n=1 Tax=Marasmiellus scandens TaxID=2682957 RepID=A0ABR1IKM7_9AGAR
MFSKVLLVALTTAVLGVVASPAPIHAVESVELGARAPAASPTITLCTAVNFGGTCIQLPVVSDSCTNFTGGLTVLNKELSSAVIPGGFICTLFTDFGCSTASSQDSRDEAALVGGSYPNFSQLNGIAGIQNFNDVPSSFSCSPL